MKPELDPAVSGKPRPRPVWVWIISIFCVFATAFSLFTLIHVLSSPNAGMTDEQRQFFDSQTWVDDVIAFGTVLANMTGAILLFFLRRAALYFFLGSFVAALLHTIYNALMNNLLGVIGTSGLVIDLIGWSVNLAIVVYVWSLARKGLLR
jgi:hypothetical protein